ncbi:hypothetical protein SAMN05192553_102673 [Cyclobacterium xiamenense]|uniref:Uncharacterized protein n=1 Tax=Cyclobacterium xiamenense TaxID=1297121 RepID=A0A1H6WFF6_9BACT|nr:hypothetical protein [Cyclobacterium xiamenense]SEJ15751.1 hypothetical protein SAMN05192553_102673 [Cyclobacterium xiamenense]
MRNFRLIILIGAIGMTWSCEQKSTGDTRYEEAHSAFAAALVAADLHHQIDDKRFYEEEFVSAWEISEDSLSRYAAFFTELVDANFYFDGKTPLADLKTLKQDFDTYEVKFREKGFSDFCQALAEWNELYGKPETEYTSWLQEHEYTREEFEKDILDVNIRFGQLCKIKSEKEKRDRAPE